MMKYISFASAGILIPVLYFSRDRRNYVILREQKNYVINKLLQEDTDIIFDNHLVKAKAGTIEVVYDSTDIDHVKCFCVKCQEEAKGKMNGQASIAYSNYKRCEHGNGHDTQRIIGYVKDGKYQHKGRKDQDKGQLLEDISQIFLEEPSNGKTIRLQVWFSYGNGLSKGFENYSWIGMDGEDCSYKCLRQSYCEKHIPDMIKDINKLYKIHD